MNIEQILIELRSERDRLDEAITALEGRNRRGRKRGSVGRTGRKRRLTPEGRKRLSEMMKKRWADRRRGRAA